MTSISASSSSWQQYSPSQLLQQQIQQDINSGQIPSSDQAALTSALGQIQTSLQQGATSTSSSSGVSTTTSQPPSAQDLQNTINGLISQQVSSGALTTSQATELQNVFQQAFGTNSTSGSSQSASIPTSSTPVEGHHGGHGHHHHAAPVDAAASTSDTDGDSATGSAAATGSTTAAASSSTASPTQTVQQLVDQFLQNIQAAQSTNYGASGTTNAANSASLILNITV